MITAESIVKKCLESGCGPDSLRELARGHGEPLYGQILAVLEEMASAGAVPASADDSGVCETAAYPVAAADGGSAAFFIADDAPADEPEDAAVDFDVMAELATGEESVAEVYVGGEAEEEPAAEAPSVAEAVCGEMEREEADMLSEMSADYIPEAEAEETEVETSGIASEKLRLAEAQTALAAIPAVPAIPEEPQQESRRERRRRERAEKKKQKKTMAAHVGEPMTLLTPIDVIEDDSQLIAKIEEEIAEEEAAANNVILFNEKFPVFAGGSFEEVADEDAGSYLRMIPPINLEEAETAEIIEEPIAEAEPVPEPETEEIAEAAEIPEAVEEAAEETVEETIEEPAAAFDRDALVRAMLGVAEPEECPDTDSEAVHTIVAEEPMPEPEPESDPVAEQEEILAREAAIREEMEQDYQARLDAFALRILDAQTLAAASETRAREKDAELASLREQLDSHAAEARKLAGKLEQSQAAILSREEDLHRLKGMKEEHERLYREFEDLRKAYNEVVTDVMPTLQTERDDLALTVERQCANESALRESLGSARKRVTAGYALASAACLAFIALPLVNWLKSEKGVQEAALERQQITELEKTLQREVRQNVNSQNAIVDLENRVEMAQAQILDLQGKNRELTRVATSIQNAPAHRDARSQDLAVFAPAGSGSRGVPTRASAMALQGTERPGEKLRVNEVRDPAGSIEQVMAMNRERQRMEEGGAEMASAESRSGKNSVRPIAMSAVARKDAANRKQTKKSSAPKARAGEVLAKVKKGEGVAQVVYRELGTWDPQVISWVIQENKIPLDKRGNPRIHPDQTLRLPEGGRTGQSASR